MKKVSLENFDLVTKTKRTLNTDSNLCTSIDFLGLEVEFSQFLTRFGLQSKLVFELFLLKNS
jgi:hypothetical protein